jgi:hypothetical protein
MNGMASFGRLALCLSDLGRKVVEAVLVKQQRGDEVMALRGLVGGRK